jgi:hypothetical protein
MGGNCELKLFLACVTNQADSCADVLMVTDSVIAGSASLNVNERNISFSRLSAQIQAHSYVTRFCPIPVCSPSSI